MHPFLEHARHLTRRQFFGSTGVRLGGAALALLLDETREDWKQEYTRRPFRLPDLPSAGR